ncbi:helix-turn-helix domain-containing protein [Nocardia sp. NPDC048505]|uniref:TetR/AcrR family transcriptional regulator n=1 Tax=unclassified Nocardia TaxID=2637762 RepID=UPI003404A3B2
MVEPDPAVLAQVLEPDEIATRVLRGAREQFELVGIRRTTMEDVARHCGIARASLYRRFPTKSQLVDAVVLADVRRYFEGSARAHESGHTIAEKLVNGTVFNVRFLREHTLLQKLLRTEPEALLPGLTIGAAALLDLAIDRGAAQLAELLHGSRPASAAQQRHLRTVAELHTRLTLSFALTPHTGIDLDTVDSIRAFAHTYLLPPIIGNDSRPTESS